MGICTYAIVEVRRKADNDSLAFRSPWFPVVDTFCFWKDGELREALRESLPSEQLGCWPKDAWMGTFEREERGIDQGMMWATPDQFIRCVRRKNMSEQVEAASAFLASLRERRDARILFYDT